MWRSAISDSFARLLGLQLNRLKPVHPRVVGTAHKDGQLQVLGEPRQPLRLRLGHLQHDIAFSPIVIKDLGMDLNLSGPFLKQHEIDQLHSQDALLYHGERIQLHPANYVPEKPSRVNIATTLSKTTTIPPYSQMICMASVKDAKVNNQQVIIEGNPKLVNKGLFPQPATIAVVRNGLVPVCLCNLSPDYVRLKAGTQYGCSETIASIDSQEEAKVPDRASPGQKPSVQQRLREIIDRIKNNDVTSGPKEERKRDLQTPQEKKKWLRTAFNLDNNALLLQSGCVNQLVTLLYEYFDVISVDGEFGHTSLVEHAIHTEDVPPIKCRARPINPWLEADLKQQVHDLLERQVIEKSKSPWNFPLVAAPKKNGKIRWCVDYRKLNDITLKDAYPIPCIEDNLARLCNAKIFSCLDGSGAFHVIDVRKEDRAKTAFSTPWGSYQYKRMPFGLTNGPASYSRLIQLALEGIPASVAMPYLDDIIVTSVDMTEHFKNLERILQVHRQAGLKLQPSKCQLFQQQVEYLGHLVSEKGVQPVKSYLEIIDKWPMPRTKNEIRVFLGKTGYYRRFIKGYSGIAGPLSDLAGKGTPEEEREELQITPEMKTAFHTLKQHLQSAPILAYPRFNSEEPFIVDTDWSHDANAIGGVLSQVQDGKERVIQYGSKKLSKSQRAYGATKGELTAFLYFAKHWSYFLRYRPFVLRTDHHPLRTIRSMQPQTSHTLRMLGVCADLDFDVVHRAGTKHLNADALSRAPHVAAAPDAQDDVAVDDEIRIQSLMMIDGELDEEETKETPPLQFGFLRQQLGPLQEEDEVLRQVSKWLKKEETPEASQLVQQAVHPEVRTYFHLKDRLAFNEEGLITYLDPVSNRRLVCLPTSLWQPAVRQAHEEGGHAGINATSQRLLEVVFFPHLKAEVTEVLKACVQCQKKRGKNNDQRHTLHATLAGFPFQRLCMDFVGPLHEKRLRVTKNKYIFTVRDTFSKWMEAFPVPAATSDAALSCLLTHVFPRFGIPEVLHSDRGTHFTANVFPAVAKRLGIKLTTTPAYNPKSNPVERAHQDLGNILRAMMQDTDEGWETLLPQAVFAMNTTVHTSIGVSPFRVLFGRDPSTPLHLIYGDPNDRRETSADTAQQYAHDVQQRLHAAHRAVREELDAAVERRRRQYHQEVSIYHPGQLVWLFTPAATPGVSRKLQTFWTGPWRILECVNQVTYRIQPDPSWSGQKEQVVSVDRLKPYHAQQEGAAHNVPPQKEHDVSMATDFFAERPCPSLPLPQPPVSRPRTVSSSDDDSDDDDTPAAGGAVVGQPQPAVAAPNPQQPPAVADDNEIQQQPAVAGPAEDGLEEVPPTEGEVGAEEELWWDQALDPDNLERVTPDRDQPPSPPQEEQEQVTPRPPPPLPPRPHERGAWRLRAWTPTPIESPQTPTSLLADRWQQQVEGAARQLRFADSPKTPPRPLPAPPGTPGFPDQEFHTPPERPGTEERHRTSDGARPTGTRPKRIRKPKRDPDFEYY